MISHCTDSNMCLSGLRFSELGYKKPNDYNGLRTPNHYPAWGGGKVCEMTLYAKNKQGKAGKAG
jgi:hypothetical protein